GSGGNPHLPSLSGQPVQPLDLQAFLSRLETHAHPQSLKSALLTLKRERMQLFSQAEDNQLSGVVRSRTTRNLSYACLLGPGGFYACCSTNMFACTVMRGKLCQHLLVLLIGLAKSGQLDLGRIDQWVQDTAHMRPSHDK